MEECAGINEQSRLGTLLTAGSRARTWEEGAGVLCWGRSLADKDQTPEGAVAFPDSQHLPRGLTLAGAV